MSRVSAISARESRVVSGSSSGIRDMVAEARDAVGGSSSKSDQGRDQSGRYHPRAPNRRGSPVAGGEWAMAALPAGAVTLLFTDIEGSTALVRSLGDEAYEALLAIH